VRHARPPGDTSCVMSTSVAFGAYGREHTPSSQRRSCRSSRSPVSSVMIVMALDLDGTPPTGSPEEHHRDPPRNSRGHSMRAQMPSRARATATTRPASGNAQRRERRASPSCGPEGYRPRAREAAPSRMSSKLWPICAKAITPADTARRRRSPAYRA